MKTRGPQTAKRGPHSLLRAAPRKKSPLPTEIRDPGARHAIRPSVLGGIRGEVVRTRRKLHLTLGLRENPFHVDESRMGIGRIRGKRTYWKQELVYVLGIRVSK